MNNVSKLKHQIKETIKESSKVTKESIKDTKTKHSIKETIIKEPIKSIKKYKVKNNSLLLLNNAISLIPTDQQSITSHTSQLSQKRKFNMFIPTVSTSYDNEHEHDNDPHEYVHRQTNSLSEKHNNETSKLSEKSKLKTKLKSQNDLSVKGIIDPILSSLSNKKKSSQNVINNKNIVKKNISIQSKDTIKRSNSVPPAAAVRKMSNNSNNKEIKQTIKAQTPKFQKKLSQQQQHVDNYDVEYSDEDDDDTDDDNE